MQIRFAALLICVWHLGVNALFFLEWAAQAFLYILKFYRLFTNVKPKDFSENTKMPTHC